VLDVFSRRVVGWAMSAVLETTLLLDALNMALWNRRRPRPRNRALFDYIEGGIIHTADTRLWAISPRQSSNGRGSNPTRCRKLFRPK
jgi:transposase InsO family protein